jgi:hypothetical protein
MPVLSDIDFEQAVFNIADNPVKSFSPFVFYNKAGDCIEFYVSQNDYYAERIDDYLTLFLDMNTDEIVGFMIKNIKQILNKIDTSKLAWSFIVNDDEVQLGVLFTAIFLSGTKTNDIDEVLVREYKKVVKVAENHALDKVSLQEFAYA